MMKFDPFVLPFVAGLAFLLTWLGYRYSGWYLKLDTQSRKKVLRGFFSLSLFAALKEIISESLLHKKIFTRNSLLGFMHMSLAFGWFLLILVGNIESRLYQPLEFNPPYIPIFFRFFHANPQPFPLHKVFSFAMDLLLLLVLSGVALALAKRIRAGYYGMKRTTSLKRGDRFALAALWLIFPLRFLAEAFTSAAYGGGDFLTGTAGKLLGSFLPAAGLCYPAWWAYSLALGVFFVALPFSRYMHIPTEVVLIMARHAGLAETGRRTPFTEIEINACSRCGICLDACQLSFARGLQHVQSVYALRAVRYNQVIPSEALNCLMCGRCQQTCPVGIDIRSVRLISRIEMNGREPDSSFHQNHRPEVRRAEVIYFAGCMTHQCPSIKDAMKKILDHSGVSWWFMDESGGLCCGRPLKLAGYGEQAKLVRENNIQLIRSSGASILVTSCPICYKMFRQDYNLEIRIMHHTEYLNELADSGKISLASTGIQSVYHDPCELSRELKLYAEPRALLNRVTELKTSPCSLDDALCCGNSLANLAADSQVRLRVSEDSCHRINPGIAELLVTSCPLCKKSFDRVSPAPVKDIAEVVLQSLVRTYPPKRIQKSNPSREIAVLQY